jgi:hypothetical protein
VFDAHAADSVPQTATQSTHVVRDAAQANSYVAAASDGETQCACADRRAVEGAFAYETLSATLQERLCALLGLSFVRAIYGLYGVVGDTIGREPTITEPVAADGNCFFRAVCFVLTGSEDQFDFIRQLVCNYIERYYTELQVDPNYVVSERMRSNGTWATDVEILAVASLLRCNMLVYSNSGTPDGRYRWLRYEPVPTAPSVTAAVLAYTHAAQFEQLSIMLMQIILFQF